MPTQRKKKQKGLTPSVVKNTETIRISIDENVLNESKKYAEFIGITSIDETIEKALEYVLNDDPEWSKVNK